MLKHMFFITGVILLGLASSASIHGGEVTLAADDLPSVHLELALQSEFYGSGDSTFFAGMAKPAVQGFVIRDAKLIVEGQMRDYFEYNLEVGSAACLDGGFMVIEAGLHFMPHSNWKAGITKGHVLRGFEMYQECVELLTAEKPVFAKKFSPCHPLGAVVEYERDFGRHSGILAQFVVAEGSGGTLEDEHDINLGVRYRSPVPGLSVALSGTWWRWNAPYSEKDSVLIPGGGRDDYEVFWRNDVAVFNGYRSVAGVDYDYNSLQVRCEGYLGEGFKDLLDIPHYALIWQDSSSAAKISRAPYEDLGMAAFFVQAGYTFLLQSERFRFLQPYAQYQWWDQATNLDGDYASSFLTFGMSMGIGESFARLRVDYQMCLDFASDGGIPGYSESQQADRLMVRLQAGI